jgi:outer membrane biosynthesis protein TonB
MKVLTISRGNLEIARVYLLKPVLTIGRSPTCDVVLRAPGVKPMHFLIEWIGAGTFDPAQDNWSISDISKPAFEGGGSSDSAAEGIILTDEASVELAGFTFRKINDQLEAKPVIGGNIKARYQKDPTHYGQSLMADSVVELVQIRSDSGAVEEVRHISPTKSSEVRRVLRDVPEFRVQWDRNAGDRVFKIIAAEMPGAQFFNRGQKVNVQGYVQVQPNDVLQVRWKHHDFYVRFVPRIKVPLVPREILGDPLLKKLGAIVAALFVLILGVSWLTGTDQPPEQKEPPRVARIEVAAPEPPPPPTPPPPEEEVQKEKVGLDAQKAAHPSQASAPKYKAKEPSKKIGLNSSAKVGSQNAVGILGALKNTGGAKGRGVRADMIINNGIITEAASSPDDESKIVVKNPPAGIVGTGTSGNPSGRGNGLAAAGTTFAGGAGYNPNAGGPISRKGASGLDANAGSSLGNGAGAGVGSGSDIGSLDTGSFSVQGGLDRETVRRVIASYRGQIRACYDKALLRSKVSGRIVYRWQISPSGPVVTVNITQSTVSDTALEGCVLGVIRSMIFPAAPNGRPTTVIYPFVFQSNK